MPAPPTFSPTSQIPYTLILWSKDATALSALSRPSSILAGLCANEVYGKDALSPRTEARRSRKTKLITQGSVIHVSGGAPSPNEEISPEPSESGTISPGEHSVAKASPLVHSVVTAGTGEDDVESNSDEEDHANYPGTEDHSSIVTLRGEVAAEAVKGLPSFNYKYFNRNVSY